MIEIKNLLQEKIIRILLENYPITLSEIFEKINVRKDVIEKEIMKMEKQGIIEREILPDKVYIRLKRMDFKFIHKKYMQKKEVEIKEDKKNEIKKDNENFIYV